MQCKVCGEDRFVAFDQYGVCHVCMTELFKWAAVHKFNPKTSRMLMSIDHEDVREQWPEATDEQCNKVMDFMCNREYLSSEYYWEDVDSCIQEVKNGGW